MLLKGVNHVAILTRDELTVVQGSEHEWVAKPEPQTDRAREMIKAFIARQWQA